MNKVQEIQKMHRQTCVPDLKEASKLTGYETEKEIDVILEKCQCIQIANLINGFNKSDTK